MAKSKWVVEGDRYTYRIQWFDAEEQDLGAIFGDGYIDGQRGYYAISSKDSAADSSWARAHNAGVDAVKAAGLGELGTMGFEFESNADAQKALKLLNACYKAARDNTPWPAWALQAQASGWKAPKGWKP